MLFLEKIKKEPVQFAYVYYIHANIRRHYSSLDMKCCPQHSYVTGWLPATTSGLSHHSDRVDLKSHYLING